MRARRFDPISVVERAYHLDATTDGWLDGLVDACAPSLDRGFGVSVGTWQVSGARFTELSVPRGTLEPQLGQMLATLVQGMPSEHIEALYGPRGSDLITSLSTINQSQTVALQQLGAPFGVHDLLGVLVVSTPGVRGLALTAFCPSVQCVSRREQRVWRRLATHVGAGHRLRESLGREHAPEAVLSPRGEVHWADGEATSASARVTLSRAVKNIERARGKLRRTSPDEALSLWNGLVEGRWSIVEWVDTDSRRFLLARVNHRSERDVRALARRERDVAEYVVQGRSTGEIAWSLGLGTGTVSRLSREVLRKLGGARRIDLAALFGGVTPVRADLSVHDERLIALAPGSREHLWRQLTRAEKDVTRAVLRGVAPPNIARQRRVSVKTIHNQLGAVYARLGVRGRTELAGLLGASGSDDT